jgi:Carboxypeptidase regulatory-like domain
VIAAFALTAIMMQAPARDARPAPAVGTATVAGIVVSADAQARPLRRARVTINGAGMGLGRTAITADDGTFAFTGLPAGSYGLAAAKDGYVPISAGPLPPGQRPARIAVASGETQKVTLRLPRGGVITGVILDVDGQPAAGMPVTALARRYIGNQGERRYVPVNAAPVSSSDDRGMYRIYGLPAGEFVVAVQPRNLQVGLGATEVRTMSRGTVSDRSVTLAQVFHSGATDLGRATPVAVRAGEERSGIDIQLQYVPIATISGTVTARPGWDHVAVTMARADEVAGFEPIRSAHTAADGRFTLNGVPPGRYRVWATSRASSTAGAPTTMTPGALGVAVIEIAVEGEDITNLALSLEPGLVIAGRLVFEATRPAPAIPAMRTVVPVLLGITGAGMPSPSLNIEGSTFRAEGIAPGPYRAVAALQGVRAPIGPWWLKSLVVSGRDLLDAPLDLRQSVDDAVATFADAASELSGTVRDAQGNIAADAVIVAFSTDRATWFFNSRRVAGVRPDAQGRYAIRNLPPGEYRIAATADLEQMEWFDPTVLERLLPSAATITITGVEKKTHDLVIR